MAHELDINEGKASFASAREHAWHRLGTVLPHGLTAEDAMKEALLGGWNVRKRPIFTTDESGEMIEIPNQFSVVRNNPVTKGQVDVLGVAGRQYHVIQNEDHASLLNLLVEESGAHFETAGALDGGRRVFITMKLPGHIRVGGVDPVDQYIAAMNSHDMSSSFTLMVTPIRVVCANTENMAYRNNNGIFRVQHKPYAGTLVVNQARQALDMSFNYLEEFQQTAERLIQTTMTQQKFEQIIAKEFGAPEDAANNVQTRADNKLDSMAMLFGDGKTQAAIRNTAWAGLNALTEWYDHFSPVRGPSPDTSRAQRTLLDTEFKNTALRLMLAEVK